MGKKVTYNKWQNKENTNAVSLQKSTHILSLAESCS